RIRDDRDVYFVLPRQPVRHRSAAVAVRLDAGAVRGRRSDPAFPDPQGAWAKRHAANLSDLCAVAVAVESCTDAVHRELSHGAYVLLRRGIPYRRALHTRCQA